MKAKYQQYNWPSFKKHGNKEASKVNFHYIIKIKIFFQLKFINHNCCTKNFKLTIHLFGDIVKYAFDVRIMRFVLIFINQLTWFFSTKIFLHPVQHINTFFTFLLIPIIQNKYY